MVAVRKKQNTITILQDSKGKKLTTHDQIAGEVVSFFQSLLGAVDKKVTGCSRQLLAELLTKKIGRAHV